MLFIKHVELTFRNLVLFSVLSLFLWTILYFLLKKIFKQKSAEFSCRMLTFVHGTAISVASLVYLSANRVNPFDSSQFGQPSPVPTLVIMVVCLGYFMFDLCWCIHSRSEGWTMLVHHWCSTLGLCYSLWYGHCGIEILVTLLGTELTNPLLQWRWFLRDTNHKCTTSLLCQCKVVEGLFCLLFVFFRIVLGSFFMLGYWRAPHTPWFCRIGGALVYIISWIFWGQIVRMLFRKYVKKPHKTD